MSTPSHNHHDDRRAGGCKHGKQIPKTTGHRKPQLTLWHTNFYNTWRKERFKSVSSAFKR